MYLKCLPLRTLHYYSWQFSSDFIIDKYPARQWFRSLEDLRAVSVAVMSCACGQLRNGQLRCHLNYPKEAFSRQALANFERVCEMRQWQWH